MSKTTIEGFYTKRERVNIEVDIWDEYYSLKNYLGISGLVYISKDDNSSYLKKNCEPGYYRALTSYDFHKGEDSIIEYELVVPESNTKKFELYKAFDVICDAIISKEKEEEE